jgi:hypothetical protein
MKISILWNITTRSPLNVNGHFGDEDGSDMFLRNVSWFPMDYTALYRRSKISS